MRFVIALVLGFSGALFAADPCLVLPSGTTLRVRAESNRAVCFSVDVGPEEATQLSSEQPVDLSFRIINESELIVIDGFEFGTETITILTSGHHRVEVRQVDPLGGSPSTLSMSRHDISLQTARLWRDAEILATRSKQTGKIEDIAKSLQSWRKLDAPSALGRTYLKEGDVAFAASDALRERESDEEALRICNSIKDLRCAAEAANNSGYASFLLGDLKGASDRLGEAAEDWRRLSLSMYQGQTLSNLGLMFWQSGDYAQAIAALEKARVLLQGRNPTAHALVLNNLGVCYQSLSENEKAIAFFQSALTVLLVHHEMRHVVEARLNLGRSYMLLGWLGRAEVTLRQSLSEATKNSNAAGQANVLNNLGQVLLKLHRGVEARTSLNEALRLQRQLHSRRGEAIALHYLGIEAVNDGDIANARQLLTEAASIRRECGLRDDASDSVLELAELEYHAGNLQAAHDLTDQSILLIEALRSRIPSAPLRAAYYARKRRVFDLLTDIAMSSPNDQGGEAGLLSSERAHGRSLLDLITEGAVTGGVPESVLARRTALHRQIDVFALRLTDADPPNQRSTSGQDMERLREDLRRRLQLLLSEEDQIETQIREEAHASALGRPLSSVAELQAILPEDAGVLEYYLGERQSYLWLIRHGSVQSFRLAPRASIETLALRMVSRFNDIGSRRRSPNEQTAFEADTRRLSDALLRSLAGLHLPRCLIFVPDGVLNRVPMAALRIPGARAPLGLISDIVSVPSAAYLLAAKPPRPVASFRRSILAFVDPVFSADDSRLPLRPSSPPRLSGLARLPLTGEVDQLRSLVAPARIQILQGFDASLSTLKRFNIAEFAVVHFSTHAFIDDRIPELSRVALSLVDRSGRPIDGYLYPHQFADLRMDGSIVVLSSCETALGKEVLGEGLAGFSSSLFSAGASQLVLALTDVDAESSEAFFAEAYRSFFTGKASGMEVAATQARKALAHSDRWGDPYYWASFVVVGSPNGTRR